MTFLKLCAEHICQTYASESDRLCVVLPNRRSGIAITKELKNLKIKHLPEVTDIEVWVSKLTGMENTNPVLLLLELFEVFSQIDKKIKLEKFTGWGYILLKDFDQIDRNLVDADKLFRNLQDIKNLERWKLGEDRITPRIEEYFQLWEHLSQTYHDFRERLLTDNQAYSGMMYRELAENADSILLHKSPYDKYVFIGFNALSKAEERIFKTLTDLNKAEIIWDADEYYMQAQTENKAGYFLKKYKHHWASTNWKYQTDNLGHSDKEISIINVANASMQGKVANQLLKNWILIPQTEEMDFIIPDTALVLADEQILLPALHSLDEQFAGLNITIGLSLKDSAIFNLVDTLFEQFQTLIKDKETEEVKFSHRTVTRLLTHPFVRQYEKRHCQFEPSEDAENQGENRSLLLLLLQYINKNNLIFLGKEELLQLPDSELFQEKIKEEAGLLEYCNQAMPILQPLFENLFARWKNTYDLIDKLEEITKLLFNEENYFEAAYFQEFDKILKQLKFFVFRKPEMIDIRTFKIFLYQAFREAKFEFEGNKDTSLQLLGINETRNLDFENLIILSVNETVLPRSKKINSFIPIDIAQAYELPTYQEQDAIVSYHFYRLLQRAQKVALVYVSPSDTYGGKEKSRFILQLESDLARMNTKVKIKELNAKFRPQEDIEETILEFAKGETEIQRIKHNFLSGLTPSHINSFVTCSLQYYFNQIADIGRSVVLEETLGADKLGSLVHEILEEFYRSLAQENKFVGAKEIEKALPTVQTLVDEKFNLDKYANYIITGQNFIVKNVTAQFINRFLEKQIEEIQSNGAPFEILSLENREADQMDESFRIQLATEINLDIEGEPVKVWLKGITDRIDKVEQKVRIIDYKTSKVEKKQVTLSKNDLDKLVHDSQIDKVRQLWLYKYIVVKKVETGGEFQVGDYKIKRDEPITAGIYSLRNLEEGLLELKSGDKDGSLFPETIKEYIKTSEDYLSRIIKNMLDPTQKFEKTEDINACKFCNYKDICGR
jgi:hypothetical protein